MSAQFSEAQLSLKQVDVPALGELEHHALSTTLRAYGLGVDDDEIERGTSEIRKLFGGRVEHEFDESFPRRFAGDRTLPRDRYYTLVDDEVNFDHRTLLQEMSAYLIGSTYPGLVSLFETAEVNTMELLAILAEIPKKNYRSLDLAEPSLLIALRPITPDAVLQEAYGKGSQYVVQIPYRQSRQEIRNVLDLRQPAARKWLVDQFSRNIEVGRKAFPVLLGREPPVDFSQLLPSLLDQWMGGGWSTANMVGFFARGAGANGLVYPSARSNPWVELEDEIVASSSGWCFVSYADAPVMEMTGQFSIASDAWPPSPGYAPANYSWVEEFIPLKDVQITYEGLGSRAGSFSVMGLAEYNWAGYRLSQVATLLKSLDDDLGSYVSSRLAHMALYSAAPDLAWLAGVIIGAFLGGSRYTAALEWAAAAAGSDYERETLADAQTLVARVPRSFHVTGPLADALGLS